MSIRLSIVLILSYSTSILGQNLLLNAGFEETISNACLSPDQSFDQTRFWYSLDATPDLFDGDCPYNETENFFWDQTVDAFEGRNFAGLSARWNSNATYVSEGIATKLAQTLEAGKTYFFSMAVKNQGGYQGLADPLTNCSLRPEKHIDLYTSSDSIILINNFSNGTAVSSAELMSVIDPDEVKNTLVGEWIRITTCFKAKGGESYFAVQMPLGTFGELPTCAANASSGVFRSFYYYIDDLTLNSLPQAMEEQITICRDGEASIDLMEIFGASLPVDPTFAWQDGYTGAIRVLQTAARYHIDATIDCGAIPVELVLKEEKCSPDFYAPTAFTPNGDGINDAFEILVDHSFNATSFALVIYDRWGSKLYESSHANQQWDGTFNGNLLPSGIYLWSLQFEVVTTEGNIAIEEGGSFVLVR
ncbi:MAG: gliding motility-associated C-terminal domain-containing protein [Saprospiraceae bacterium]|nr:gliding motility-associated C-terminal domain-containing protein [Saprospiraceae bacterium]